MGIVYRQTTDLLSSKKNIGDKCVLLRFVFCCFFKCDLWLIPTKVFLAFLMLPTLALILHFFFFSSSFVSLSISIYFNHLLFLPSLSSILFFFFLSLIIACNQMNSQFTCPIPNKKDKTTKSAFRLFTFTQTTEDQQFPTKDKKVDMGVGNCCSFSNTFTEQRKKCHQSGQQRKKKPKKKQINLKKTNYCPLGSLLVIPIVFISYSSFFFSLHQH